MFALQFKIWNGVFAVKFGNVCTVRYYWYFLGYDSDWIKGVCLLDILKIDIENHLKHLSENSCFFLQNVSSFQTNRIFEIFPEF